METLHSGLTIMIIGMSTVFVFLTIMIFAMKITSKIIQFLNKYFPEAETEQKKNIKTNQDAEIALAVAVAVQQMKAKEQ